MVRTHSSFVAGFVALSLLGPAGTAHAQTAYDPFTPTTGTAPTDISSDNGGTGWSGEWTSTNGSSNMIVSGSLSADGVDGGATFISSNNQTSFRTLSDTTLAALHGGTVYVSFLVQGTSSDPTSPNYAGISLVNNGDERLFLGKGYNDPNYGAGSVDSTTTADTTAHFLVYKITEPSDYQLTLSLFVDPTLGAEPAVASATSTIDKPYQYDGFNQVRLASGFSGNFDFDELRLGTTYASVVPAAAPEPSAWAVVSLGTLGIFGLVARKRRILNVA